MVERIKRGLTKYHLDGWVRKRLPLLRRMWWVARTFGGVDRRLIARYLCVSESLRLHIGCGGHVLDGWLNTDLFPLSCDVGHLDATRRFPFDDETFDCIFSEHMIEHLPYSQGARMLAECHRVLKKGGKIRISTPDLKFLIDLYQEGRSALENAYVNWANAEMIKAPPENAHVFVINNFVRAWGHQFIYDRDTLAMALKQAGFTEVCACGLNQSGVVAFQNLENERRMPEGFLKLETMTIEGTKG